MSAVQTQKNNLDPRSKLAVFIAACFSAFSGMTPLQEMALLALCLAAELLCRQWSRALRVCVLFSILFLGELFIIPRLSGGILWLAMLTFRLCRFVLPLVISFSLVTKTSTVGEYISAFMRMHLPSEVIIPLAVMFRFVPTVHEEWQSVTQALHLRGLGLTWNNVLRHPMQMLEYTLVPFLLQCSVIVDEMSAAVMARGFDRDHPRTSYLEVRMNALDWCIVTASVSVLAWNLIQ